MGSSLADRVSACLLALNATGERRELLTAGVPKHTVAELYPPAIADLHPTLRDYMAAGGRVEFPSPGTLHEIKREDDRLGKLPDAVWTPAGAKESLAALAPHSRRSASRLMAYANVMIGMGERATFANRHAHVRTGLGYLERAFWYAGCCTFHDQNRVGHHLLRVTRTLLPELLPEEVAF